MRKAALAALLLVLVPLQARALDTEELLGLVAMPLAVAAASEVTGVPVGDLSHFVATLNRAQMPPTQVVQVVRYAPAALVVQDQQPTFVEYIDTQVDQGITGPQLVTVIEDRYETYDLDPQFVVLEEPATTYVVREDYIPEVVVTRVSQFQPAYVVNDTNDLLALAAMPLAVAAVAELTGVPMSDLSGLVASLNAARVPPLQMVEVLRYSPVVMVDDTLRPRFVQFVNTQVVDGVTGLRLVDVIDDQYRTYDLAPQFNNVEVVELVDDDQFFPAVVTSRVAEVRSHPHGGPPGQLKKQRGLQTGAEVVHGTSRGRPSQRVVRSTVSDDGRGKPARRVTRQRSNDNDRVVKVKERPRAERQRVVKQRVEKPRVMKQRVEQPRVERRVEQPKPERAHRGRGNDGGGGGNNKGHGAGQGHGGKDKGGQGKGKGKG